MSYSSSTPTDRSGDVAREETAALIASDKVEGTSVYDTAGNSVGSIHTLMIGKKDGHVDYAVLSFGGFLGIGTRYYPLPWHQLTYSAQYDGYVVNVTPEQLEGAPYFDSSDTTTWADAGWRGNADRYYGVGTGIM